MMLMDNLLAPIICTENRVTYSHKFIQGANVWQYTRLHIPSGHKSTETVYVYHGSISRLLECWNRSNPTVWSYTLEI